MYSCLLLLLCIQLVTRTSGYDTMKTIVGDRDHGGPMDAAAHKNRDLGSPSKTSPAIPSVYPTRFPTVSPSQIPSVSPTLLPSVSPSQITTVPPIRVPTVSPSQIPTVPPTLLPTVSPSQIPSVSPTRLPTISPSQIPSYSPNTLPVRSNLNVSVQMVVLDSFFQSKDHNSNGPRDDPLSGHASSFLPPYASLAGTTLRKNIVDNCPINPNDNAVIYLGQYNGMNITMLAGIVGCSVDDVENNFMVAIVDVGAASYEVHCMPSLVWCAIYDVSWRTSSCTSTLSTMSTAASIHESIMTASDIGRASLNTQSATSTTTVLPAANILLGWDGTWVNNQPNVLVSEIQSLNLALGNTQIWIIASFVPSDVSPPGSIYSTGQFRFDGNTGGLSGYSGLLNPSTVCPTSGNYRCLVSLLGGNLALLSIAQGVSASTYTANAISSITVLLKQYNAIGVELNIEIFSQWTEANFASVWCDILTSIVNSGYYTVVSPFLQVDSYYVALNNKCPNAVTFVAYQCYGRCPDQTTQVNCVNYAIQTYGAKNYLGQGKVIIGIDSDPNQYPSTGDCSNVPFRGTGSVAQANFLLSQFRCEVSGAAMWTWEMDRVNGYQMSRSVTSVLNNPASCSNTPYWVNPQATKYNLVSDLGTYCIDNLGGGVGSQAAVYGCKDSNDANQLITTVNCLGCVNINNWCLDAAKDFVNWGDPVALYPCNNGLHQWFEITNNGVNGLIRYHNNDGSVVCVNIGGGRAFDNAKLIFWNCDATAGNERFTLTKPANPPSSSPTPCFRGSELVTMESGDTRPISSVRVGDRVLAADAFGNTKVSIVLRNSLSFSHLQEIAYN